jgi:hypothetical protein
MISILDTRTKINLQYHPENRLSAPHRPRPILLLARLLMPMVMTSIYLSPLQLQYPHPGYLRSDHKSPESSTSEDDDPPPKRSRARHTSSDLIPASFQRWEVGGLSNMTLDGGSGRCCLHWKDTEISESNIRDKGLIDGARV